MDKMKFETVDGTRRNVDKIAEIFPQVVTEVLGDDGKLKRAVKWDVLKQLLSGDYVEGGECYEFTWPGKRKSIAKAAAPIRRTLRPCVEESKNWDTTENLYIEGDNLEVLKLLQESYLGKVKMIYIDPPYNTGNDFIYKDDFTKDKETTEDELGLFDEETDNRTMSGGLFKNTEANGKFHSDWCSMIYERLLIAKDLLSDDGVIFISINDKEIQNLKKICAEVFGEKNEIATLIWDKNHSAQAGIYKVYHEYILVYAKNIDFIAPPASLNNDLFEAGAMKKISGRHPASCFTFPAGTRFNASDGTKLPQEYGEAEKVKIISGCMMAQNNRLVADVTMEAGFTQANQMQQYFYGDRENLVDSQGQKIVEFYFNSAGKIKIVKKRSVETPQTTCKFGTQAVASNELSALFELEECPFSSPKPVGMLTDFIRRFTKPGDIIVDFFSGSATTAHAVLEVNSLCNENSRSFILVQFPEDLDESLKYAQKDAVRTLQVAIEYLEGKNLSHTICEIGKERIRRAGEKIKEEAGLAAANLDIGFRVFKVADSNMKDVYYSANDYSQGMLDGLISNIKEDRTDLDLLYGCLLDWGVELSLPHTSETIDGVTVHTVDNGALIACFDANIPESAIRTIAKRKPLRAVFRDSSFASAPQKINVEEIFKLLSPTTTVKVI